MGEKKKGVVQIVSSISQNRNTEDASLYAEMLFSHQQPRKVKPGAR